MKESTFLLDTDSPSIKTRFGKVDEKRLAKRLAICSRCNHFQPLLKRCGHCGCFVRLKAAFKSMHCPLAKW